MICVDNSAFFEVLFLEWRGVLTLHLSKTSSCQVPYLDDYHNYLTSDTKQLSLVMRKPVFGVCDQVRLKLACSASEAS